VRESSCPGWGLKVFSDEEATQCRAGRSAEQIVALLAGDFLFGTVAKAFDADWQAMKAEGLT